MSIESRWDRIYERIDFLSSSTQLKLIELLKNAFPDINSWNINYTLYPSQELINKVYKKLDKSGRQAFAQYENIWLDRPGDGEAALALALGVWYAQKQASMKTLEPSTISPLVSRDYMKQSSVSPLVSRDYMTQSTISPLVSSEPSIGPLAVPKPNFNGAKLKVNSF
jgi:hypothetical protein